MLKRLYISNFALIGEMNVSFPGGLTVITGETGAGKSIFLEALGLALGNRADLTTLKNKNKKCIVEAEFDLSNQNLEWFFRKYELDNDLSVVLRREISADGKSRSLINDSVVTLGILKQLAVLLIDIHSQHQTLLLNESEFQMDLLDAFANSGPACEKYKKEYKLHQELKQRLNVLLENESAAKKELDYYQFLFKEFEQLDIKPGHLEKLESESALIENAEQIKLNLSSAANQINAGEVNILNALNQTKQKLHLISKFNGAYTDFYERLNAVYIELKDLSVELENAESVVFFDADRLQEINAEMDVLNRLMNKHQVKTEEELNKIKNNIENKLIGYNSIEGEIEKLKKELAKNNSACLNLANELSALRKAVVSDIELKVKSILGNLAMINADFKIELLSGVELSLNGIDTVKFLFSANKGIPLNELGKVASGGELSRLMLTLKSLLATKRKLPTIIFDEIDTGVSGEIANKIGNILFAMGNNMQVITITHLPQMASKGQHHLFVYKNEEEDKANSLIREIKGEERIIEIAKMLSAGSPTQSAIVNATELLSMN